MYDSSLSWNTTVKLVDTEFTGTATEPSWEYNTPEWDDDSITTHNLTFNLVTKENNMSQTLSLVATLPPTDSEYTLKLALVFPFLNFSYLKFSSIVGFFSDLNG